MHKTRRALGTIAAAAVLVIGLAAAPAGASDVEPPDLTVQPGIDLGSNPGVSDPRDDGGPVITPMSAHGVAFFGAACVQGVCWPGATLGHSIIGSGQHVERQEAYFTDLVGAESSGRQLCNWRIDFVDYRIDGSRTKTLRGTVHKGCQITADGRKNNTPRNMLPTTTKSCAELYSADTRIVRQCHFIS